ncbi:hypothetical protein [Anaeromicrobium sediminis]|uniref:Uncharacterized protein n=1 Tax=Anaeromicrobium sediminis TaxID=1478221 RepID=A0A267MMP6_9FIRM|nr:hypothetical protein [Anaeromicrobium sediminis]PAB60707.1 hypothetical protein CCE28_03980 [Anaeromicrobium sediminis]
MDRLYISNDNKYNSAVNLIIILMILGLLIANSNLVGLIRGICLGVAFALFIKISNKKKITVNDDYIGFKILGDRQFIKIYWDDVEIVEVGNIIGDGIGYIDDGLKLVHVGKFGDDSDYFSEAHSLDNVADKDRLVSHVKDICKKRNIGIIELND